MKTSDIYISGLFRMEFLQALYWVINYKGAKLNYHQVGATNKCGCARVIDSRCPLIGERMCCSFNRVI